MKPRKATPKKANGRGGRPHPRGRKGNVEKGQVRRVEALDMRIAGMSYRQIAAEMGVDVKTAWKHVQKSLADLADVEQGQRRLLRKLELERCDRYLRALEIPISRGDARAVAAALRVGQRRSALLGLDAPKRHEHTGKDGNPLATPAILYGFDPSKFPDTTAPSPAEPVQDHPA